MPVSESEQIVEALRRAGRAVRYLLFDDDGHEIVKRENRTALTAAISEWLNEAFSATRPRPSSLAETAFRADKCEWRPRGSVWTGLGFNGRVTALHLKSCGWRREDARSAESLVRSS